MKGQTEDCKCVDLPNGERIYDPIDCELYSQKMNNFNLMTLLQWHTGEGGWNAQAKDKDVMKALLQYIRMKKHAACYSCTNTQSLKKMYISVAF